MILLLDIGNTNTHAGLARGGRIVSHCDIPTRQWFAGNMSPLAKFCRGPVIEGVSMCSVVPKVTPLVERFAKENLGVPALRLTYRTVRGIGVDYPKPVTIGADRLANAMAARALYGAPVVVVDFGTAVTFDVVNGKGNYIGGVIAPGLSAMTSYLHEKTALLPRITIREISRTVGRSTREAMLIGAVHGYRGLIREILGGMRAELKAAELPVVATGGYARLIAAKIPEIARVSPLLTLEGLRLLWEKHH